MAGQFGPQFAYGDSPQFDIRTQKATDRDKLVARRINGASIDATLNGRSKKLRFPLENETMQVFASGDATPSVKGGGMYQTAGTTAITDFDDGVVGDILYIEAKSSITITHGTPIQLNGDANYTMVSGDTLILAMFDDQVWVEIARGGQSASGGGGGAKCATLVIGPSGNSDSADYDYVTDGTDDDVQIQAAIDAIDAAGGGRIVLREGTYTVGASIVPNADDTVILEGMGYATVLTLADTLGDIPIIEGGSALPDYFVVSNIRFEGNSTNQTNAGARAIELQDAAGSNTKKYVLVEKCWFNDFYSECIIASDYVFSQIQNCYFTNWAQTDTDAYAISGGYYISGNYFDIASGMTLAPAIALSLEGTAVGNRIDALNTWSADTSDPMVVGSTGCSIVGNAITCAGVGSTAILIYAPGRSIVSGNYLDGGVGAVNASSIGIQVAADHVLIDGNSIFYVGDGIDNQSADNVVISDNMITSCEGVGIVCRGEYCSITGNTIFKPKEHGIHLDATTSPSYCVVSNNTIEEPCQGANNTYYGIFIDDTNNAYDIISGNTVIGVSSGNQPHTCIFENTNAGPSIITSNVALNGSTANLTTNHGSTVSANNLTS